MAANQNGDEARLLNGEDAATTTSVDAAGLLTDANENASQGNLVVPSSVPELCAALNNLITKESVPLSGTSKPCDRVVAMMPQVSLQATTVPKFNGCKEPTSTSREKRKRESENTSEIPVRRRLRLSEDTEKESVLDYDAVSAELWIEGEKAACEAYELSKLSRRLPRDPRQVNNAVRNNNNPLAQPVTKKPDSSQITMLACFQELIKVFRQVEAQRRTDSAELIRLLRELRRDFTGLSNKIHNIRVDQRQMLEAISLLSERMHVIEMFVTDTHKTVTGQN